MPGRARHDLLSSARLLAAAVEPKLLHEIPSDGYGHHAGFERGMLVNVMLQHKHVDAAFEYVTDGDSFGFPFGFSAVLPVNLPLPTKIVTQVLPAIDIVAEFGEDPDVDDVDAHVRGVMQRGLDMLAAARRLPVIG